MFITHISQQRTFGDSITHISTKDLQRCSHMHLDERVSEMFITHISTKQIQRCSSYTSQQSRFGDVDTSRRMILRDTYTNTPQQRIFGDVYHTTHLNEGYSEMFTHTYTSQRKDLRRCSSHTHLNEGIFGDVHHTHISTKDLRRFYHTHLN